MRIGVLSDTHGRLPQEIVEAFKYCDHIIHAGDVGSISVLIELEEIAPLTAVLGNNDYSFMESLPRYKDLELGGVRFLVAHSLDVLDYLLKNWQPGKALPHVCIYGHTHVPKDFLRSPGSIRMINPGSLYGPRGGSQKSALLMEVTGGNIVEITPIIL